MGDDPLTSLYRRYGPFIYARCVRMLGDRAGAEDATQETFLRVHRHLHRAPDDQEALAWIYRIATNYCLNEIRNRKLRTAKLEEPVVPADSRTDLEAVLADRDIAARIVRHSPERLRVTAWLHYVDGFDQGEVARLLGVSRRNVVYRLGEFLAQARAYLSRGTT